MVIAGNYRVILREKVAHSVQEARGHKIICSGSSSKVALMLSKTMPKDSSCYNDLEKKV